MKLRILTVVLCVLLTAAFLLPVAAATAPADPLLATVRTRVAATVGIDTAGAAVGVYRNGEAVLSEGYGYVKISDERLVTPDTVFELGGVSSVFVAIAAHRAEEQGLLSLNATIDAYLPADLYAELGLSYPVTTEQLLLGCAGFDARTFDLTFGKESHRFKDLREALLAEVPGQVAMPGEYYSHSTFGIALAAYVLECATGRSYAEYVTTDVLTPLGMTGTYLDPDADTAKGEEAMK